MRIQHNIMAMNAYRNYNTNTKALSGNLEKLSSGYKINRAGDDAAGLAISEKMRAQITGLEAAQKNVKDGISLVKTAEGAMQEIQDMLNRMDYLATQSANGTYQDEVDRENLQKEVEALKTEINRIADSANFNGIKLLDGSIEKSAGGKTEIKGSERILSAVIGNGEKANEVNGEKTILDDGGGPAVKGVIQVDLSTLKFTSWKGSTGSATLSNKFSITIGDKTINGTLASGVKASSATSGKVLKALVEGIASACSSVATINGVKWDVADSKASKGILQLTMQNDPLTQDEAKTDFDVSLSFTDSKTTDKDGVKLSESHLHGTVPTTLAQGATPSNRANTTFKITENDIRDGTTITIGETTLTLKVGKDSKVKGTTGVVDLSGMEEGNINLDKALSAIAKGFGASVKVKAKDNSGATASMTFLVGVSDGANGNETGITVQRQDDIKTGTTAKEFNVVFTTKAELASIFSMEVNKPKSDGLRLQIGDTSDSFNQMGVSVKDMHVSGMGITDVDISTQDGAADAVQVIKDAINYVSSVRGDLGAVQNRLEHTGNNLSVMAENIQDAESTIRDTDVANEMMSYVKNNILVQSAQAMLAQANQVPQGVLQLLG